MTTSDPNTKVPLWKSSVSATLSDRPIPNSCDVAIIGGGISAALTAYALAEDGTETIILESHRIASGSTATSGAVLDSLLDRTLVELVEKFGEQSAFLIYREMSAGLSQLKEICHAFASTVGYEPLAAIHLASSEEDVESFKAEQALRAKVGLMAQFDSAESLLQRNNVIGLGALRTVEAAVVNPVALTHTVFRDVLSGPAKLYEGAKLVHLSDEGDRVLLKLETGETIHAKHVVLAVGSSAIEWLPQLHGLEAKSCMVAFEDVRMDELVGERAMLWDMTHPRCFVRPTLDDHLLVGCRSEEIHNQSLRGQPISISDRPLPERWRSFLPRFPQKMVARWDDVFSESADGLPLLGTTTLGPRVFVVVPVGRNGLVSSQLAAMMVKNWVQGTVSPNATLFGFGRPSALGH